jgi:hypothetical protein
MTTQPEQKESDKSRIHPKLLVSVRKEVESDVIQGWRPGSGGAANVEMREPPQIQS